MPTQFSRRSLTRGLTAATALAALAGGLAACGGDSEAATTNDPAGTVTVGRVSNGAARQTELKVSEVKSISAELPASVRKSGTLKIVVGALPDGFPPLAYVGSDQKTLTGAEPDFGRLVAAVLGLKPQLSNATWENMFVGIDSGKADVGFANITDTEERKKKYDFASYRKDNVGFEVLKKSTWNFDGDYENLAGKTVAVDNGTNQEKILLEFQAKLKKEGKNLTVKHYAGKNATYLALTGGKIDAYFSANPGVAYHVTQTAKSPDPTRSAGTYSGAGAGLQGLIAATTKKDSGLAKPIADAINHLIKSGQYGKWLAAYNLSDEAVDKAEVNPPGLPLDNS
ncbi:MULTISPECIES: transporter substrate-binding domain-containing protein [unclassified Streptomyces]|uniref:transporter substrate-binding domain-containing protein n=1 Tax=unclassified Streptomyces TaxID=2593676 RepID=UPI00119F01D2|nr:transporter substrate-binding domain-containing protein [Streptomyces sp. BK340]TVZ96397.1 amino acid ABC transporter substrate-binding protein (PAAT family) [Streptomyces sp. BK340]